MTLAYVVCDGGDNLSHATRLPFEVIHRVADFLRGTFHTEHVR